MRFFSVFQEGLRIEIGNGQMTMFWKDKWCGDHSLMREFPAVFSMAANPLTRVSEYFEVNNEMVGWQPILRRPAFNWEVSSIALLLEKIGSSVVRQNQKDRKILVNSPDRTYSVKAGARFFGRQTDLFGPWK